MKNVKNVVDVFAQHQQKNLVVMNAKYQNVIKKGCSIIVKGEKSYCELCCEYYCETHKIICEKCHKHFCSTLTCFICKEHMCNMNTMNISVENKRCRKCAITNPIKPEKTLEEIIKEIIKIDTTPHDKNTQVGVVRVLLNLCGKTRGKENKCLITYHMFKYLENYGLDVLEHENFRKTVMKKIVELRGENKITEIVKICFDDMERLLDSIERKSMIKVE